jgi:hypothetical protein
MLYNSRLHLRVFLQRRDVEYEIVQKSALALDFAHQQPMIGEPSPTEHENGFAKSVKALHRKPCTDDKEEAETKVDIFLTERPRAST